MATSTVPTESKTGRTATGRNLALSYVAGVLVLTLQSIGYHLHTHDNKLASDIPFYVISGLVGVLIAAIALFRVRRSRKPATTGRVAVVLGAFGIAIFPVAYYMPITFILGATSYLLSQDADPGRTARVARVLGIVAMLCSVAVVVARACGVTYQLGG
jgi:NO-binding membrane sensor protein with MHYT domain